VRENPDEFYRVVSQNAQTDAEREMANIRRERETAEKRIAELESIIRCLYEDRVLGRITVERYESLSSGYEAEEADLKKRIAEMDTAEDEQEARDVLIRQFIADAEKYIDIRVLTPEILRAFIRRIEVSEKEKWHSADCGNDLKIYFTVDRSMEFNVRHKDIATA
jgi:hypothetical protein